MVRYEFSNYFVLLNIHLSTILNEKNAHAISEDIF